MEDDRKIVNQMRTSIFPMVKKWVQKNKGTLEDAEDIFNDAILIMHEKIKNNTLTINCKFSTYFMSICMHLWHKVLRKRLQMPIAFDFEIDGFVDISYELTEDEKAVMIDEFIDIPYDSTEDEKYEIYLSVFDRLDPRCKELIKLKTENKSNAEIARIMNFKNTQAVADKKKSCMKKLVKELAKNKDYKEFKDEL